MKLLISAMVFVFAAPICLAQETKVNHRKKNEQPAGFDWLKQFEGDWTTEYRGTMKSRIIGQRWIVNEISFPQGLYTIQTIGYDAKNSKFVGTWVDASSSYIWQYSGALDKSGRTLVLQAKGPDMSDPTKTRQYRDTYEFKSKNEIALTSQVLDDKKQWKTFNKGKMTRKTK